MKYLLLITSLLFQISLKAEKADNESIVRRLYIDLFGRLPEVEELFSAKTELSKVGYETFVETMLDTEDFTKHLSYKVAQHYAPNLSEKRNSAGDIDPNYFQQFVRMQNLIAGTYFKDDNFKGFIKDLTQGRGISTAKPALYFYDNDESLEELTGRFADRVLGIPLKCVQCHNHREYKDLYQIDFWGMATFFKNTEIIRINTYKEATSLSSISKLKGRAISKLVDKEDYRPLRDWITNERKNNFILEGMDLEFPTPNRGRESSSSRKLLTKQIILFEKETNLKYLNLRNPEDKNELFNALLPGINKVPIRILKPRTFLSSWVLSPKNPYLKKATTNWVSYWIFGRAFKMPLTDIYGKGMNDELLNQYSDFLLKNDFSLKKLIKKMVLSDLYLSKPALKTNNTLVQSFKQRPLRQIPIYVLEKLISDTELNSARKNFDQKMALTADTLSYFPKDEESCEASFNSTLPQHVFINFSEQINNFINRKIPKDKVDDKKFISDLISHFYSRKAKEEEVSLLAKTLIDKEDNERTSTYKNILWVIINNPEMRLY